MKKLVLLVLTLALCVSLSSCSSLLQNAKSIITGEPIPEMPADFIAEGQNEEYSYEIYDDYIKIMKYIGEDTEITIPDTIDGKPVKVIGSLCFHQTTEVTSVNIPKAVTIIESSAFYYADKLTSVSIPDNVTSIGSRAFAWCISLENVSIGKGVEEIPEYCFNNCTSLKTVSIPSNVKRIGLRAFSFCGKIEEFVIPKTVEKVGERAFSGCPSLEFLIVENPSAEIGDALVDESPDVAIIAKENSKVMNYCKTNGLRWSASKDVESVVLGGSESEDGSSNAGSESENK